MIRCGNKIRLHQSDIDRIAQMAGVSPRGIGTVEELNDFVELHCRMIGDSTPEAKLIGLLLASERIQS